MPDKTTGTSHAFYLEELLRHFADLRDGTHGDGAATRAEKENLFTQAVAFMAPHARRVLNEINDALLLQTGTVSATGITRSADGDLSAEWALNWPEQKQRQIRPVMLQAVFGLGFMHPHLCGATVGYWPLNIFSESDASRQLPILRAVASADLHNLVFQSDYRIIPAITDE